MGPSLARHLSLMAGVIRLLLFIALAVGGGASPAAADALRAVATSQSRALIEVASSAQPSPPAPVQGFACARVFSLPFGKGPNSLAVDEHPKCCGGDVMGIAFAGPDNSLYLFDYGAYNLKKITFASKASPTLGVIPGPRRRDHFPMDGCAAPDGSIYLLTDAVKEESRFRLLYRGPADTSWTATDGFNVPDVGVCRAPGGETSATGNAARVSVVADSEAALADFGELSSARTTVAVYGRLLPPDRRVRRERGIPLKTGTVLRSSARGVELQSSAGSMVELALRGGGSFIGADDSGHSYFLTSSNGVPPAILESYDAEGRLFARQVLPRAPWHRGLYGRGHWFVLPNGMVLQLLDDERALNILNWTTGGRP